MWGKNWFVDSLNDPPRPAELITFASAYSSLSYTGYEPVDGFYKVIPPYFIDRYWYERPTESTTIEDIARMGYVQYRYSNRAVVGFFDSHADMLGWEEMQDMRHWAPQADRPDWVLPR